MSYAAISDQVELFRNGLALLPEAEDADPGAVIWIRTDNTDRDILQCDCRTFRNKTCAHIKKLSQSRKQVLLQIQNGLSYDAFRSSRWHALAEKLFEISKEKPDTLAIQTSYAEPEQRPIRVINRNKQTICTVFQSGPSLLDASGSDASAKRFQERCVKPPNIGHSSPRLHAIETIMRLTLSETERAMLARGAKTRRLAFEESFWHKFAYHFFREFGPDGCGFTAAVDTPDYTFSIHCRDNAGNPVFQIPIPAKLVPRFLPTCAPLIQNKEFARIHPIPLKPVLRVRLNQKQDLVLQRYLRFQETENAEPVYYSLQLLQKKQFGKLIYLTRQNCFAAPEEPDPYAEKFNQRFSRVVKNSRIPHFIDRFGTDIWKPPHIVDDEVRQLSIRKTYDTVEIQPEAQEQDWYWISVTYGFGNQKLSLTEILKAKQKGKRFIPLQDGWIDTRFLDLGGFPPPQSDRRQPSTTSMEAVKVSRLDLFKVQAACQSLCIPAAGSELSDRLQQFMAMQPTAPFPEQIGLTSSLRPYQRLGAEWLTFLYENRFGGLLCDDMGLGKTHQVMAFMLWLMKRHHQKAFLVVCPTTVMSHWETKIRQYAPELSAGTYHGLDRDLKQMLSDNEVVITSFGILLRDRLLFSSIRFSLVVFDEAQHIKNAGTKTYSAALSLQADMKLCVTGTPIENRLSEIKALMDMAQPGYLGTDHAFANRYTGPIENDYNKDRREELIRMVHPFTLRRLKQTVLSELPEKIDDIRYCRLTEDQVKLYNDAISTKGSRLIRQIRQAAEPIPYIHIFALLNLLKQICDHPVLIDDTTNDPGKYASGKWELFKELLETGLESGQKIVIYSQYLKMIRLITDHLRQLGVDHASLTGSTRNRGDVIQRFNQDQNCRVFVGSLKAGGSGIDLVAASIVIHYDRWWNAAKEDQATDRVHRIGQKRGVQVFKLVTYGTLEEKISAMIEKKRSLMESILQEDDADLLKSFTPEQLMDILAQAGKESLQ